MSTTVILFWILFWGTVTAVVGNAKGRGVGDSFMWGAVLGLIGLIVVICGKPGAPKGMYSATCARCNSVQNVPQGQAEFACWQCHTVQHVTRGVLA